MLCSVLWTSQVLEKYFASDICQFCWEHLFIINFEIFDTSHCYTVIPIVKTTSSIPPSLSVCVCYWLNWDDFFRGSNISSTLVWWVKKTRARVGDSYLLSPTERDSSGHFECPRNISSSLRVDGGKLHCFLPWKPAILASQPPFSPPYHYSISANVYPSRKSAGLYSGKSSEPPFTPLGVFTGLSHWYPQNDVWDLRRWLGILSPNLFWNHIT